MAATTRTALKAFIEALGLGLTCFQDEAPQGQVRPYVVIVGPISAVPDRLEDGGTFLAIGGTQAAAARPTGQYQTLTELLQVDLFQTWRNPPKPDPQNIASQPDHALLESYTLPDQLYLAIHGARLPTAPQLVYACILRGYPRLFERDSGIVHHAGTIAVRRQATG